MGEPDPSTRTQHVIAVGLLIVLCGTLFLRGLGRTPFYDKGEAREAVQVWEAVHTGDWILPLRNGVEIPSKPPLFHWLAGLSARATGSLDERALRLPSALGAVLVVGLVGWFGARRWGLAAGLYAGAVLATSFEWLRAARLARTDMVLAACLTGAFVAFHAVATAAAPSLVSLVLFYVCIGLAVLAKGPVGIALPVLLALAYLAARRDLRRLPQMRPVLGIAIVLALAGTWYLLAIWRGGEAFVNKQILAENLSRFVGRASGGGHAKPAYYYVPRFLGGFAPWSIFLIPAAAFLYRQRGQLDARGYLYPLLWFAVVFGFYSAATGKRTVYLLPAYPAAALLLGAWWSQPSGEETRSALLAWRGLQWVGWAAAAIALVLVATVLGESAGADPLLRLSPLLHRSDQANISIVRAIVVDRWALLAPAFAALATVAGLGAIAARRRRAGLFFAALVLLVGGAMALVNDVFRPALAQQRTLAPFAARVDQIVGRDDRLVFYDTFDYGTVFYAQRHIEERRDLTVHPPPGRAAYVLLWKAAYAALPPTEQTRLEVLLESDGFGPQGRDHLLLARVADQRAG